MAPSLANIPDAYLWLGFGTILSYTSHTTLSNNPTGLFTILAIPGVSHGLHHIVALTEIRNPPSHPPQPQSSPQHHPPNPTHQEDAIKTSSLLTLATSPNIDIRNSATKILCHRFYASKSAKKLLVKDLNSTNDGTRHRAHLAFDLLATYGALERPRPKPVNEWRVHAPEPLAQNAADLRRRRREAVVIHDGEIYRPIDSGDVYMRDREGVLERENESALRESIALMEARDWAMREGLEELFGEREIEGLMRPRVGGEG
jgi:hypothetical protein